MTNINGGRFDLLPDRQLASPVVLDCAHFDAILRHNAIETTITRIVQQFKRVLMQALQQRPFSEWQTLKNIKKELCPLAFRVSRGFSW